MKKDTEIQFLDLVEEVKACVTCPRMNDSARVLSLASGSPKAKIMFIGEAPGRRGADKTQIPFHGDVAGNNFEDFLSFAGIHRSEVFITNAVLCNPRDEKGNNSTPNTSEVANCSKHLRRQLEIINPKIVVTLGATALNALKVIEDHNLTLKNDVRTARPWNGRLLAPLYHPGQRAIIHRSKANQRSDYQFIAETFNRLGKKPKKSYGSTSSAIMGICKYMLSKKQEMTYFELHKYFYLLEYSYAKINSERLTNAHFIRQKDGPYCTDLHIDKIRRADPSIKVKQKSGKLTLSPSIENRDLFDEKLDDCQSDLAKIVDDLFDRYSYSNEADLKRAVYFTAPMKMILRKEKSMKQNFYNSPIDFISA